MTEKTWWRALGCNFCARSGVWTSEIGGRRRKRLEKQTRKRKDEPVIAEERAILERLDELVRLAGAQAAIRTVVGRVRAELARKPEAVMTWEPMPLAVYGNRLPPGIQSSWVFILRAGINTGPERHPNSHQRMMSLEGAGDMQVRADSKSPWQSHILKNDPDGGLETRWISIPQNVWHQPVVAKEADWVVVSFHTVLAEELIEERPDPTGISAAKRTTYLGKDGE